MPRKIRIIAATLCFLMVTILFLDFTGTVHRLWNGLARIQLVPALMAGNALVLTVLLILTALFGRIYCSVICPLGVFQDLVSRMASRRKKNRFSCCPEQKGWRYGVLGLVLFSWLTGIGSLVAILDPYAIWGRAASVVLSPLWQWGNNLLAHFAKRADSYAVAKVSVWFKGTSLLVVVLVVLGVVIVLAWRKGRLYCNTICPAGTILGLVSRIAIFRPRVDSNKCNGCGICARNCKSSCISPQTRTVDMSRCVDCFDCLATCPQKAIHYGFRDRIGAGNCSAGPDHGNAEPGNAEQENIEQENIEQENIEQENIEQGNGDGDRTTRRGFLTLVAASVSGAGSVAEVQSVKPKQKKVFDGGVAPLTRRISPVRTVPLLPPGSRSLRDFTRHCTGCQLCVGVCPNEILRPSGTGTGLTQPTLFFERGYCRPECTRCSEVCPTGAIQILSDAEKSSIQIGYAVWVREACIVLTDGVPCGNCFRHCPTAAIEMVPLDPTRTDSPEIPTVNTERCIGCGACEYLCPARPTSAIYVEGIDRHRII